MVEERTTSAVRAGVLDTKHLISHRWRAMGSACEVHVVGGENVAHNAASVVEGYEQLWSRFRSGSELSRVNANAGSPTIVSEATFDIIALAQKAASDTRGMYNPLIGRALLVAGYDTDFNNIDNTRKLGGDDVIVTPEAIKDASELVLDRTTRMVWLPRDTALDLGGIAKGYVAELVAHMFVDGGATGALVNIGGDIAAWGTAAFTVDIAWGHPPQTVTTVGISQGAIATSSTAKRRWQQGNQDMHHAMSPQTGTPILDDGDVTVVGGQGWCAEVYATALLVAGSERNVLLTQAMNSGCEAIGQVNGHRWWTRGFKQYDNGTFIAGSEQQ